MKTHLAPLLATAPLLLIGSATAATIELPAEHPRIQAAINAASDGDDVASMIGEMPATRAPLMLPQPPSELASVWRYMDLPRLVSLLHRRELHLCRLPELEHRDPEEGRWAPHALNAAVDQSHGRFVAAVSRSPETLRRCEEQNVFAVARESTTKAELEIAEMQRISTYVSSWCLHQQESALMWSTFGGNASHQAVALRTTYQCLAESLPAQLMIGMVNYYEHCSVWPRPVCGFHVTAWKRPNFRDEREVRVLFDDWMLACGVKDGRLTEAQIPRSVYFPIDLAVAKFDLVVSPQAPVWFAETAAAVVQKFAPEVTVVPSEMLPSSTRTASSP